MNVAGFASLEPCAGWTDDLAVCLDGEPPRRAFADHLAACADCRAWFAAGQTLFSVDHTAAIVVPADLADRVFSAVRDDHRQRTRQRWLTYSLGGLAAAASIVWAVGLIPPAPTPVAIVTPPTEPERVPAPEPEQPTFQAQWQEATEAVASLTRRAADEALPTPMLPTAPLTSPLAWQPNLQPAVQSLQSAGNGAAEGLEPMTRTARRAFEWILKDAPTLTVDPPQIP